MCLPPSAAMAADVRRARSSQRRRRRRSTERRAAAAGWPRADGVNQEPAIVVVWTTKGAKGTKLLHARSDDGGRSFGRSLVVAGTDEAGNRGWQAVSVEASGRVDVVWLDHRELASDATMAEVTSRARRRPEDGRRCDGAEVEAVRRVARRVARASRRHRGRVLLLQDGARKRCGRPDLRGVASRVSGQPARHGVRDVARWRPNVFRSGASQRGQMGSRGMSGRWSRAWPSTAAVACTSSGRRWCLVRRTANRQSGSSTRPPATARRSARASVFRPKGFRIIRASSRSQLAN